jgi:hypothetical protein
VQVPVALLADGAVVVDGVPHVAGTSWNAWEAHRFPTRIRGSFVALIRDDDANGDGGAADVTLSVIDAVRTEVHQLTIGAGHRPQPLAVVIPFDVVATAPGVLRFVLSSRQLDVAAVSLPVCCASAPEPALPELPQQGPDMVELSSPVDVSDGRELDGAVTTDSFLGIHVGSS